MNQLVINKIICESTHMMFLTILVSNLKQQSPDFYENFYIDFFKCILYLQFLWQNSGQETQYF